MYTDTYIFVDHLEISMKCNKYDSLLLFIKLSNYDLLCKTFVSFQKELQKNKNKNN